MAPSIEAHTVEEECKHIPYVSSYSCPFIRGAVPRYTYSCPLSSTEITSCRSLKYSKRNVLFSTPKSIGAAITDPSFISTRACATTSLKHMDNTYLRLLDLAGAAGGFDA